MGDGNEYFLNGGDSVIIPYDEKAYFVRRHSGIYFDPLPNKAFRITKRFDARSFGGEVNEEVYFLNFTSKDSIDHQREFLSHSNTTESSKTKMTETSKEISRTSLTSIAPSEVVLPDLADESLKHTNRNVPATYKPWLWLGIFLILVGTVLRITLR